MGNGLNYNLVFLPPQTEELFELVELSEVPLDKELFKVVGHNFASLLILCDFKIKCIHCWLNTEQVTYGSDTEPVAKAGPLSKLHG